MASATDGSQHPEMPYPVFVPSFAAGIYCFAMRFAELFNGLTPANDTATQKILLFDNSIFFAVVSEKYFRIFVELKFIPL
jgi:hypothetical protein